MNSSSSIIALIALLLSSCAAQQQPSCSICGDGMEVGNPDASVSFPGQAGQIPCGVLQSMATVGLIPPSQCVVLPQLVGTICECVSTTTTTTTTTVAAKPGGKSSKSSSMSVSPKAGKSTTTKSSKSISKQSSKSTKSASMMIVEFGKLVHDTTTSTISNADLITFLSWIVYSETPATVEDKERAEQVDSLDAQSIEKETNEILKDISGELIQLNENFKNMGK